MTAPSLSVSLRLALGIACGLGAPAGAQGDVAASRPAIPALQADLTDANFAAWREHIRPRPAELAWQSVPWLPTFEEGILAADARAKPLLLWVMNGHPLGCT